MIAIKLYHQNSNNIPPMWPKEVRYNELELPAGFDLLLADATEYKNYLEEHQTEYNEWATPSGEPPSYDIATQNAPEWNNGAWVVCDKTPEEIAAEIARLHPPAEMWQVKVWMVRNGIDLASIPSILAANIPAGPQLQEALVRWESAPRVPFDNMLVGIVAEALKIKKEDAWADILSL